MVSMSPRVKWRVSPLLTVMSICPENTATTRRSGTVAKSTKCPGWDTLIFQYRTFWFFEEMRCALPVWGRSTSRKNEWPCSSMSMFTNFMA